MKTSYYIQRQAPHGRFYWNGNKWDRDEAKGYTSENRALNAARNIVSKAFAFADEISIEVSK